MPKGTQELQTCLHLTCKLLQNSYASIFGIVLGLGRTSMTKGQCAGDVQCPLNAENFTVLTSRAFWETPKYPDNDLSAIVLSTDVSGFDEQERNPGYLAFYNVLQYSQSSNILRCLLYILYARDTYPTGITSTIMQPYGEARAFRRRAEGVLIRNISDKTVPLQWIDLFKRALEGLQHNDDTVLFGI